MDVVPAEQQACEIAALGLGLFQRGGHNPTMARTRKDSQPEPSQRRSRVGAIAAHTSPAGAQAFAKAGFADPTMVLRWAEIAGPQVAQLAQPLRFSEGASGGTLTLKAMPGAALFLAHEKRSLAARINTFLGRAAVAQIKFVQGPLARHPNPENAEKKPGLLRVDDPARVWRGPKGLKNALEALARRRNPSA